MSSRIQADLQRIDAALKSCPNRAALKSGTTESWVAGNTGLAAVTSIYRNSIFSDPNSGAAPWIQWRKSNASKQLLGFIRAVMDTAMEADPGAVCSTPAMLLTAHTAMHTTLHGCIALLTKLFMATLSAALWPAMREWLIELGGIQSLWEALAQSMLMGGRDSAAMVAAACGATNGPLAEMRKTLCYSTLGDAIVSALSLTNQLNQLPIVTSSASGREELSHLPGIVASLSIIFGIILPEELAAGNAHEWDIINVLRHIFKLQIRSRSVEK